MDWMAFLASLLGQSTSTSTPNLPPELKNAMTTLLQKGTTAFNQPFKQYQGQRVAGPTGARSALTPVMESIGSRVMGNDANGYQDRIRSLLDRGPMRVGVPSMVPGGASASLSSGPGPSPMPTPSLPDFNLPATGTPAPTPAPTPTTPPAGGGSGNNTNPFGNLLDDLLDRFGDRFPGLGGGGSGGGSGGSGGGGGSGSGFDWSSWWRNKFGD